MGGVGFMSHKFGIQAAHVNEIEIVSGLGDVIHCSQNVRSDLFNIVRGGLGTFGIMTSIQIPLIKAPTNIQIYKGFYTQRTGIKSICDDFKLVVDNSCIDMIHAFIKPSISVKDIIGDKTFVDSSKEFKKELQKEVDDEKVVFFIEFGCYLWNNEHKRDNILLTKVENLLSKLQVIGGVFFQERMDFYTYITRDPPVVETNKKHGSIPHPSFAITIPLENAPPLIEKHVTSSDRGDDKTNEILMMPVVTNKKGHEVPMFPTSKSDNSLHLFMLFLGSAISDSQGSMSDKIATIRSHHNILHDYAISLGAKRYSYDTVTSDIRGEKAWKDHYGQNTWKTIMESKCKYDPYFLFQSIGVQMF